MAEYKVAQDVEAEDKLLGPFSFRQFIYLIIVAIAIALAWGLGQIFIGLAIIPLPIILFFGTLALPLRKDQPMEVYLAAVVSFLLKPRRRIWIPDGIDSLIEITTPKVVDEQLSKDLSRDEAEKRFSYLANIADTEGWSIRHSTSPTSTTNSMIPDQYYAAQQTVDTLSEDGSVARNFEAMINQADQTRRQHIIDSMKQPRPAATTPTSVTEPQPQPVVQSAHYNPYPNIHQSVVQPTRNEYQTAATEQRSEFTKSQKQPIDTSINTVSADIINLANNSSLSVETIQHEANRIKKRAEDEGEVFISLH